MADAGAVRIEVPAALAALATAPLLPALRARLAPGGRLLCSIAENEWFGSAWISSNG